VNQTIKAAMDYIRDTHRETGRLPSFEEAAEHCNVSALSLQHYLNHNASILSLDEKVRDGHETSTYLDLIADEMNNDDVYNECDLLTEPLLKAVDKLTDKQRRIILSRYFHTMKAPPSFESIAKEEGTTRQMIQTHHRTALVKLRQYLMPVSKPRQAPTPKSAA
jgi:DNA-directed RNA polymerase sigma subunit (sigma70/sigma32)